MSQTMILAVFKTFYTGCASISEETVRLGESLPAWIGNAVEKNVDYIKSLIGITYQESF